jgi:hypothetical protein
MDLGPGAIQGVPSLAVVVVDERGPHRSNDRAIAPDAHLTSAQEPTRPKQNTSDRGMACGRFRVLGSDPERSPMHVSSDGPQADGFASDELAVGPGSFAQVQSTLA